MQGEKKEKIGDESIGFVEWIVPSLPGSYKDNYLFYNFFSCKDAEAQRKTFLSFSAPLRRCGRSVI